MTNHMEELYKRIFGFHPVASMNDAEMSDAIAESHETLRTGKMFGEADGLVFLDKLTIPELERWVYLLDPDNVEDGGGWLLVMQDRINSYYHDKLKAYLHEQILVMPGTKNADRRMAEQLAINVGVPYGIAVVGLKMHKDHLDWEAKDTARKAVAND